MKQLTDFNLMQRINGGKGLDTVTLEVKHDTEEYRIVGSKKHSSECDCYHCF